MLKAFCRFVVIFSLFIINSPVMAESNYPSKPIKLYIGFSAGSATDLVGRIVAEGLANRIKQPIVVENKVGAGGSIAAQDTARASADGYTLLLVSSAIAVNPAVYKNAGKVLSELKPIALIGTLPTVLMASTKMPVNSLKEFIDYAKTHPKTVNFGSSGVGGSTHMAMEAFARAKGIELVHIPYKGNGQASAALLGNQIDAYMDTIILAAPVIASGRAKGLAISGTERSALVPDVPTFAEAGAPEYNSSLFFGVMGPAGMPDELIEHLNQEINAVLKTPSIQDRLTKAGGLTLSNGTAQDFGRTLQKEVALWTQVGQNVGIKPQ